MEVNLETFFVGIVLATGTIVGFFYLLKLQDKYFDKMRDNGNGSLRV